MRTDVGESIFLAILQAAVREDWLKHVGSHNAHDEPDIGGKEGHRGEPETFVDLRTLELKSVRPREPVKLSDKPNEQGDRYLISPTTTQDGRHNERQQHEPPDKILRCDYFVERDER